MRGSNTSWSIRLGLATFLVSAVAIGTGCEGVLGTLAPLAELSRVDLVTAPTETELLSYGCVENFSSAACSVAGLGDAPDREELLFSFDLVFDLENPNLGVPIPLVEMLLGLAVLDDTNLGAACISFCEPGDESCVPAVNAVGACNPAGEDLATGPGDLVPTVDELIGLAEEAAAGDFSAYEWKTIPPGEAIEAHIQFDLGIDPMLGITEDLLMQAADDFLTGNNVSFDIPYTAEGDLFFDAADLDRVAVGFGPYDAIWQLQ